MPVKNISEKRMYMFEEIVKILKENYGIEDVKPESNFKKDLGLNSFDLMELLNLNWKLPMKCLQRH